MREIASIEAGGEPVQLWPERVVWWPGARTLIVSDLHLGKEHAYASVGIGIPGMVLDETLSRLGWCIRESRAARVILAGDVLHARAGLTPTLIDRVGVWRARYASVEMLVVPGNHDGSIGEVVGEWSMGVGPAVYEDGPFRFVHEPGDEAEGLFTWAGHLHPAVRIGGGRDSLKLACFCIGERSAVLPAFTMFSGKVTSAAGGYDSVWAIAEQRVFCVPAVATRGR